MWTRSDYIRSTKSYEFEAFFRIHTKIYFCESILFLLFFNVCRSDIRIRISLKTQNIQQKAAEPRLKVLNCYGIWTLTARERR